MALLRLAAEHAGRAGGAVAAFTVDHGLRPAAADEAEQVARWCGGIGVPHTTLRWTGEKPETGLQAAARAARYALLAGAAADFDALLIAHTADDLAETLLARLARGSGLDGLAAMRADGLLAAGAGEPVRIVRPLLEIDRAGIEATLARFGQDAILDPSNLDRRFERVRARAALEALEGEGLLGRAGLARAARRLRAAADAEARRLEAALSEVEFDPWGGVRISASAFDHLDPFDGDGLVRRLICAVSGADAAPSREDAARALAEARASGRATLAGALIAHRRGEIGFEREPAALLGRAGVAPAAPLALSEGAPALWDARFIAAGAGATIGPSGASGALGGAPAIRREGRILAGFDPETREWRAPTGAVRLMSLTRERVLGRVTRFPALTP